MHNQLNHKGTITLETQRLILRKFKLEDAEAMYSNWSSDEEVAKYMRWNAHKTIDETISIIRSRIEHYSEPNNYHWVIVLKDELLPIGAISLFCQSEYDRCGEVAYCLSQSFWGQGIASEALTRVIRFGLAEIGFNRIEAYHAVNNPGSGKVMKKAGMQFEGRLRQKYRSHVGLEDSDLYAILREDIVL